MPSTPGRPAGGPSAGTGAAPSGGRTPSPPGPRRHPPSLAGIVAVATAGLVAAWVTLGVFLPAIGELGRAGRNPSALPRSLELCGGTWQRGSTLAGMTRDEAFARDDRAPIVITEAGPDACPAGACAASAPVESCSAAVYVRRGEDDLVRYELIVDGQPAADG